MLYTKMFSDELMLRSHVVVKQHFWKWAQIWHVGWRRRLAIAE